MNRILLLVIAGCLIAGLLFGQSTPLLPTTTKTKRETKQEILTRYDTTGRVVNQAQDAKGLHRVTGQVKLSSGVATITLNTSLENGRQDISFISSSTYSGTALSSDIANRGKGYTILPISGTQFQVVSSDNTDTVTVRFSIEGE